VNFIFAILLLTNIFFISNAFADDAECRKKIGKENICSIAKTLANEMAKELPMQINKDYQIEKAFSYKNTVSLWGKFTFTEKTLNNYLSRIKTSQNDFKTSWGKAASQGLCQKNSATYIFITSGGIVQYTYVFKDNKPYMTIDIDTCKI
jgi:hypothetical protein